MKLITQINKLLTYLKSPPDINTFRHVLIVLNTGYYLNSSEEISSRKYMINYFSLKIMVEKIMIIYKKLLS